MRKVIITLLITVSVFCIKTAVAQSSGKVYYEGQPKDPGTGSDDGKGQLDEAYEDLNKGRIMLKDAYILLDKAYDSNQIADIDAAMNKIESAKTIITSAHLSWKEYHLKNSPTINRYEEDQFYDLLEGCTSLKNRRKQFISHMKYLNTPVDKIIPKAPNGDLLISPKQKQKVALKKVERIKTSAPGEDWMKPIENNTLSRFWDNAKGLSGYKNQHGKIIIPAKYNVANEFIEGKAIVEDKNGNSGIINQAGNYIVQPVNNIRVSNLYKDVYVACKIKRTSSYKDCALYSISRGQLTDFKYYYIKEFKDGLAETSRFLKTKVVKYPGVRDAIIRLHAGYKINTNGKEEGTYTPLIYKDWSPKNIPVHNSRERYRKKNESLEQWKARLRGYDKLKAGQRAMREKIKNAITQLERQ